MTTDVNVEPVAQIQVQEKKKRGFTLTEIAIVLGIIGLILGAIWVAAAAVYNNLRVSHANTEILQIAQGVRALYATSGTTGTAATSLTDTAVCANAVPSDMITAKCGAPGALNSPWSGGTTAIYAPASGDSFTIEMTGVPQGACINLLVSVASGARDPALFNATASAAAVGAAIATATALGGNGTPSLANGPAAAINGSGKFGGCSTITTTGAVQVAFGLKS